MTLSSKPGSSAKRGKCYRRSLISMLIPLAFLPGYVTPSANASEEVAKVSSDSLAEFIFDQYEVITGCAERQTVLTGFLLGGAFADLAVVNIDETDDRQLRIYAFGNGAWAPILDATLRPQVSFVDVANIGGRDQLRNDFGIMAKGHILTEAAAQHRDSLMANSLFTL